MSVYKQILVIIWVTSVILTSCNPISPVDVIQSTQVHDLHPVVNEGDLNVAVDGNNAFALDLLQQVGNESGNLFFSPYSISTALAMTWAGARGETETQMADVMHFDLDQYGLHPAMNELALQLDGRADAQGIEPDQAFKLHVANALWGQAGFHFDSAFLDTLALNYGAGMYLVDFQGNPESARQDINEWVDRETESKIRDIVPQGAIDAMTRLVLSNAIYFKADWASEFSKDETSELPFHLSAGSQVNVPTMHQSGSFRYAEGEGLRVLELPYAGNELAMAILLPQEGRLDDLMPSLDVGALDDLLDNLQPQQVDLYLPKFSFEYALSLKDALMQMGMQVAFDPTAADFSGMDGARDLYIGDVLHKAFVAVDEAGTEAAAATVVIMKLTAIQVGELEFRVDQPFLFLIRDIPTGTVLFLGVVMDPR